MTITALLIPVDGPIETVQLDDTREALRALVGGSFEGFPLPQDFPDRERTLAYVNAHAWFTCPGRNDRATALMTWGARDGKLIEGPLVLFGIDPNTRQDADVTPATDSYVQLMVGGEFPAPGMPRAVSSERQPENDHQRVHYALDTLNRIAEHAHTDHANRHPALALKSIAVIATNAMGAIGLPDGAGIITAEQADELRQLAERRRQ